MLVVYKVIKEDIGKILDELPRTIKIPLQGNGMATTSKKEKLQLTFGLAQNNQNTITGKWHGCHFKKENQRVTAGFKLYYFRFGRSCLSLIRKTLTKQLPKLQLAAEIQFASLTSLPAQL